MPFRRTHEPFGLAFLRIEESILIRVLLVCTGNVCRSPLAEGMLRKFLREVDRHGDIVVESAGTFPAEGAPASPDSVEIAMQNGIDIRGHAARPLSARLVDRADLILTMEPEHRERILAAFPEAEAKTFVLTTYGDAGGDPDGVPDPIGLGRAAYVETYRRLDVSLRAAIPKIVGLMESTEPSGNGRGSGPEAGRG